MNTVPCSWLLFVLAVQAACRAGGPAAAAGREQLSGWASPQRGAGQDQGGAGEETPGEELREESAG